VAGAPQGAQDEREAVPFVFTGTGGEYFRIWIVNLLLTILTLGVYSAWAKVRRLKYFYRNTQVGGTPFNYHGKPVAILTGRVLALVLLAAWNFTDFRSGSALVVLLLLIVIAPWMLVRALRFKFANSSWRGLRFGFTGRTRTAYLLLLGFIGTLLVIGWVSYLPMRNAGSGGVGGMLWAALLAIVVMLLFYVTVMPFGHYLLKRFQHSNARFGTSGFAFDAGFGGFFKTYLVAIAFGFLSLVVSSVITGLLGTRLTGLDPTSLSARLLQFGIGAAVLYLFFVAVGPYVGARVQNLVWNNTTLDAHRFRSNVSARRLFGITLGNLLLTCLTLGLYKPFGVVRVVKYRVESMVMLPALGLETFSAADAESGAALGQEAAEMFSLDIAL
jgi:uncharacterized membrane protein YjgN (DUF898 family)